MLHLPLLSQFAGGRGHWSESEALPGDVVEGIIGLLEAPLQGLSGQDAGGQESPRAQVMSLTLGSNPVVGPQLLHGHSLPGVHSEQALRVLTIKRRVLRVLTNKKSALGLLTNQRGVLGVLTNEK